MNAGTTALNRKSQNRVTRLTVYHSDISLNSADNKLLLDTGVIIYNQKLCQEHGPLTNTRLESRREKRRRLDQISSFQPCRWFRRCVHSAISCMDTVDMYYIGNGPYIDSSEDPNVLNHIPGKVGDFNFVNIKTPV